MQFYTEFACVCMCVRKHVAARLFAWACACVLVNKKVKIFLDFITVSGVSENATIDTYIIYLLRSYQTLY